MANIPTSHFDPSSRRVIPDGPPKPTNRKPRKRTTPARKKPRKKKS